MSDHEQRAAYIQGLRDLADFFEAHEQVPTPGSDTVNVFVADRPALRLAMAGAGPWNKEYFETWFAATRAFGPLELHLNIERGKVCRRVVTGTKHIKAQPAQEVEVVEWVCDDPILSAGDR